MDEYTSHIHTTIVPIVTSERSKTKMKQTEGKRTYQKKADAVHEAPLPRDKRLVAYHNSNAVAIAKFRLQRGVRGSETRSTITAQIKSEKPEDAKTKTKATLAAKFVEVVKETDNLTP